MESECLALGMKSDLVITEKDLVDLIPEHCPDLMALVDVNGLFLYANHAHLLRLGRSPESLAGTNLFELIHPDDVAVLEKTIVDRGARRTAFRLCARWLREEAPPSKFESIGKWIPADGGKSYYLLLCSRELPSDKSAPVPGGDTAELRADAARLLARAEGERNEVARAIHDDLGQKLTAVSLELALWRAELDQGQGTSVNAIREKMTVLGDLVNSTIAFTRSVTSNLRPRVLEEFGLAAALEWHLEKAQRHFGTACSFNLQGAKANLNPLVESQVFRIAEEIVAARLQAGCRSLHVRLLFETDALAVVFEDSAPTRHLSPEISARVRLLGGEIEINREEKFIGVAFCLRSTAALLEQSVL